ncbi:MAG: hypothetical protein ACYDHX_07825 [Methanothrix sp.]
MKSGRPRKKKGRGFEVEIVKSILEAFPSLQESDVTARIMGDAGMDLLLSPAARAVLPLAIEAKRVNRLENLDLKGAMQQAKANCPANLVHVVVYREDRHGSLATLQIMGLMKLLGINISDDFMPSVILTLKWADMLVLLGGKP